MLEIKDLHAKLRDEEKEILKGVNLRIEKGEVHVLMGPNGSGKSTLANVVMGNPKYVVTKGDILFEGRSIKDLPPDERAKLGIMMTFQNPYEIEGVKFSQFLITSHRKVHGEEKNYLELRRELENQSEKLGLGRDFLERYLNVGFSGGEKKRAEILQALFLKPRLLILDEIDSGLDVDALKLIAKIIADLNKEGVTLLIITHYKRLLDYLERIDRVHVYVDGRIVKSGGADLADEIEEKGYSLEGVR
ncbi:Fe-S cluster assembly ATPase SufC [Thermotoga neapolitana]|jgi:Fe-S cluster assembly ATP-binding protein|uniref:FeS assembly ATPase SufC n=1 Tax=Thermotoga neapolitana (strain ATCC 49049 / DSM 4359 / NBRC 107923 / NS-E) TaxID=309803 RepID=B9K8W6_THENN|nr:Fe-S cluster assembly ATPase SufC [Thermotoga neapolitana]MDK2785881.1 Fe-S cluster assembly ATP-binding protein [Thermotoga sp.]ACM23399.1 FeS assembly ATPase SufC [Thermotoga neapolitana DSM 4359]KFZ21530.1 FeS assembly ATPase SufC [Thermotoga neapolitana LA10]MDK2950001.1 Fe-S cluster assembly ATP-binding protein [Thermotoga sp.]HBF11252.1 Fe-S cluster assembly ATPase SufC [Thermotoga neapolitana]